MDVACGAPHGGWGRAQGPKSLSFSEPWFPHPSAGMRGASTSLVLKRCGRGDKDGLSFHSGTRGRGPGRAVAYVYPPRRFLPAPSMVPTAHTARPSGPSGPEGCPRPAAPSGAAPARCQSSPAWQAAGAPRALGLRRRGASRTVSGCQFPCQDFTRVQGRAARCQTPPKTTPRGPRARRSGAASPRPYIGKSRGTPLPPPGWHPRGAAAALASASRDLAPQEGRPLAQGPRGGESQVGGGEPPGAPPAAGQRGLLPNKAWAAGPGQAQTRRAACPFLPAVLPARPAGPANTPAPGARRTPHLYEEHTGRAIPPPIPPRERSLHVGPLEGSTWNLQ